jgi:amidase
MTDKTEIGVLTAGEIVRLVKAKVLAPSEILEHVIARIELRNPSLNALVYLDFEHARSAAKQLERKLARGEDPGALAGVPTAMKDLFNFRSGWPATFGGIPAFKNFVATSSSRYPSQMQSAGAIMVGITNSPVFGFRGVTDNPLFGPTANPFDITRNSGGSSGGSAAAVADGLLAVAGANDGGGSIRIPSAWCGVFGFQPAFGRVPQVIRPNAFDMVAPFVFEGPITRTVEDAALAMTVLAGHDPADPFSSRDGVDWMAAIRRPIAGMKIGYCPKLGGVPVEPEVAAVVATAVRAFESKGAHVIPIEIDFRCSHDDLCKLWLRMVGTRMAQVLDDFKRKGIDLVRDHSHELPDPIMEWVQRGRAMSLVDIQHDQTTRTTVFDALERAFADVNLLVTPTVACVPVENRPNGQSRGPDRIDGQSIDSLIGWVLTYFTNLTGHPAASVPAGLARGLPVGMQIIGRRLADIDVLAASAAFEQARPWHDHYKICEARAVD